MTDDSTGPQPARIEAIDALRGLALIGIYFVNITIMGGPINSETPPGPTTLADPNWQVWSFSHLFVFGSMRGLFSMLFGASALLFLRNNSPASFVRRCFWLLCFGILNATLLLWPGDILLVYAIAAPVILLFLRASNTRLLVAAAIVRPHFPAGRCCACSTPATAAAARTPPRPQRPLLASAWRGSVTTALIFISCGRRRSIGRSRPACCGGSPTRRHSC